MTEIKSKSVGIEKDIKEEVENYKENKGINPNAGISDILSKSVYHYEESKYNLDKELKLLKKNFRGDVEVKEVKSSAHIGADDYQTTVVNISVPSVVMTYIENHKVPDEGENINQTDYVSFVLAEYITIQRKRKNLLEKIEEPEEEEDLPASWESVDWDSVKQNGKQPIRILTNIIDRQTDDYKPYLEKDDLAEEYKNKSHVSSLFTARSHAEQSMKNVCDIENMWGESLRSRAGFVDMMITAASDELDYSEVSYDIKENVREIGEKIGNIEHKKRSNDFVSRRVDEYINDMKSERKKLEKIYEEVDKKEKVKSQYADDIEYINSMIRKAENGGFFSTY